MEKLTLMLSESLQHRSFPNSGLNTKELNATSGLVPLINGRKLHIVFLTRKCLEGSVPPFLNNYFNSVVSSASVVGWGCFTPFICGGISLTCPGIH